MGLLLLGIFILNISTGSVRIPLPDLVKIMAGIEVSDAAWKPILFDFRLPKAFTAVLAGGALSVSGLLMQTFFRNPLAGPDVLGLSSGASLAVALVVMAGNSLRVTPGPVSIVLAAGIGCALVFSVIVLFSRWLRDNASLLIVGLMAGATTSSLVSLLQYSSRAEDLQYYLVWTFGSMGGLNWTEILVLALVVLLTSVLCFALLKSLNTWLLGEAYATSLGTHIHLTRLFIIICACCLTGAITAFCGPISLVGIAVPHLARMIVHSHNHRQLIPACLMLGASMMLLCDVLAQLPGNGTVLPINAITALIGAPVVIWIILQGKAIRV
jgi:iron complex transport system permease protein